jgi:hypothetical protein
MNTTLARLSKTEAVANISNFRLEYVHHGKEWMYASKSLRDRGERFLVEYASAFRHTLGRWQACRPKPMRSEVALVETLKSAAPWLELLQTSDLRSFRLPNTERERALGELREVFKKGLCARGEPSVVGISKAILLVTEGRIGPALDSNVKARLGVFSVPGPTRLVQVLRFVAADLCMFECTHGVTVESLVPSERGPVAVGGAVDMILGPRS